MAVGAALAVSALTGAGAAPENAGNPSLTLDVTPNDGDNLIKGQTITVFGAGFQSGGFGVSGNVHQCAGSGATEVCSFVSVPFSSSGAGVFTSQLNVATSFQGLNAANQTVGVDCLQVACRVQAESNNEQFISQHHISFVGAVTTTSSTTSTTLPPTTTSSTTSTTLPPTTTSSTLPLVCTAPQAPTIRAQPGTITTGTPGNDVIYGTAGDDRIDGGGGNDVIVGFGGVDQLNGGDGNDTLCGGEGRDFLSGGAGDDLLSGDGGNDDLSGGMGTDRLFGGSGADRLVGGDGVDTCTPGGNTGDAAAPAPSCDTLS